MLPVLEIQDQIIERLRAANRLVLTAPTGSGKTTQVPQIVFRSGIVPEDQQIIVLQPRRLATRMVAARVALEMQTNLGRVVGYQTRHDSAVSNATRIRFMTEGLMLRLLQSDPMLRGMGGVGCVILDEFHERNLPADISLGLIKRLQEALAGGRPDLKLVVMSATLDAAAVADYLQCESLQTGGRLHPVDVRYLPKPANPMKEPAWDLAAAALPVAMSETRSGHVLIFMPGAYEIARTIEVCERAVAGQGERVRFFPLHGSLPPAQQDAAVALVDDPTVRKVIVATNVAETSITIDGISAVIDSGLARIHRFDARRGLNALRVEPISKASADQRAGRAGRTGPGICLRLWTAKDHGTRADHDEPEVCRLELSEAVLTLKAMGVHDIEGAGGFDWLQPPAAESLARADALLHVLGALDENGAITQLGRTMAEFPAHPRLARLMLDASQRDCLQRAITWAALINERDIFTQPQQRILMRYMQKDEPASDIAATERAFEDLKDASFSGRRCADLGANAGACRDVERTSTQFATVCRRLKLPMDGANRTEDLIKSLLTAFRDHLAVKLEPQRPNCAMPGRKKVLLDRESVVRDAGLLVALDMNEIGRGDSAQTMLSLGSHIEPVWLEEVDPGGFETSRELLWNAEQQSVEEIESKTYRGLALERTARPPQTSAQLEAAAAMIVERIVAGELKLEGWNDKVEQWITRARCVAKWFPERQLISYDADDVRLILHEIVGRSARFNQVRDKACIDAVRDALSWEDQRFIEKMAPESIALPRSWHMKIEYSADSPAPQARGRAKIQDLYDLDDTPRIAGGRVPLLLEILGPNFRPVQVTSDLRGFWHNLYPELKKELKRRYPRHEWR